MRAHPPAKDVPDAKGCYSEAIYHSESSVRPLLGTNGCHGKPKLNYHTDPSVLPRNGHRGFKEVLVPIRAFSIRANVISREASSSNLPVEDQTRLDGRLTLRVTVYWCTRKRGAFGFKSLTTTKRLHGRHASTWPTQHKNSGKYSYVNVHVHTWP